MPDINRFLDVNPTKSRVLLSVLCAACVAILCLFLAVMIPTGFELFMLIVPLGPFLLMLLFCIFLLRRSFTNYRHWWEKLTESQRAEVEQDYQNAEQFDSFLILGKRYAFIHEIGTAIRYEEISDVFFEHSKNSGWLMFVHLTDGRKLVAHPPLFSNRDAVWSELLRRSSKGSAF